MVLKDWKKKIVKPNRILFTVGNFRPGKGYQEWIHIDKQKNRYAMNYEDRNKTIYEVGASRIINPNSINGKHFRIFKSKTGAMNFAKAYMRKH